MALVDTRAIEGEIDRIRSLGLEELRREWRRLNHDEPPRIRPAHPSPRLQTSGNRAWRVRQGDPAQAANNGEGLTDNWPGWPGAVPQPEARRASGSGMARPHAHRHCHGRWVRVRRDELSVPDQDRQKDHRSALVGAALLRGELADAGIKSKRRTRPDGAEYGGQTFSRGALYLILQNRIYRGEIAHKRHSYPGEQPALVDKPLWDDVQAVLAANRVERATVARGKHPSLLTGMVFDETGERLTPTYAVKKGTRYRYYVSTSLITGAGRTRSSGRRIPAGNLEGLVIARICTFLADPAAILDAVDNELHGGPGRSQMI